MTERVRDFFYVMDLLRGATLASVLAEKRRLNVSRGVIDFPARSGSLVQPSLQLSASRDGAPSSLRSPERRLTSWRWRGAIRMAPTQRKLRPGQRCAIVTVRPKVTVRPAPWADGYGQSADRRVIGAKRRLWAAGQPFVVVVVFSFRFDSPLRSNL